MDVGGWLKGLGLGQYEALFRASDIDADILPELTDVDLKELGVPLGHRKRVRRAISGLAAAMISAVPSASTGATPQDAAERRQLTVMFCDLVGSTPLSQRFDLEDLREIFGAYHRCVTDTVGRFGAKYMGDGVLIYFGYPEAHEDDAGRTARVGLAVIDAVGRLATQERLKVRIGIASGLVVVGDLIGGRRCAGAGRRRRDAKPRRPPAGAGPTGHARCGRKHQETARHAVRDRGSRAPDPPRRCCGTTIAHRCRVRFRARFPRRADVPSTHAATERSVRVVKRKTRSSSVSRRAAIVSSVISLRTNSRG